MKIFLCRHGQTTGDIEDRYGGDYDDHLTQLGKTEAYMLGDKLKNKGIKKIFTSPRIRAVETSEILSGILNCKPEVIENLRERNQYGVLTGMIKSEAKAKHPNLPEKLKDYRNTITGAENYIPFEARVNAAIRQISSSKLDPVVVITHGGPIKAILRQISYSFDYKLEDCAYAEIELNNNTITVISLNGIQAVNS